MSVILTPVMLVRGLCKILSIPLRQLVFTAWVYTCPGSVCCWEQWELVSCLCVFMSQPGALCCAGWTLQSHCDRASCDWCQYGIHVLAGLCGNIRLKKSPKLTWGKKVKDNNYHKQTGWSNSIWICKGINKFDYVDIFPQNMFLTVLKKNFNQLS